MSSLTPLGALANVASTGIGAGAGAALAPPVQELANEAWRRFPHRPVEPVMLAQGVAEGQIERDWAESEALNMGINAGRFARLIAVFDEGPGVGYAFELWRRGKIGETAFRRALKREAFEEEWVDALVQIKQRLLTPAELAVMIQRTVVSNPGILPNQPSTAGSNVPPMPQVGIDPVEEAAGAGIDKERLAALARIIGLPASPDLAARMVYRGIITKGAFNQAILEGNTRGEWAPFLFEGFRQIPTAHDGIEGRLRGWISDAEMYAETARHGMSKADTDLLSKITGRPISFHQVFIGERRGGTYDGPTDAIDPAFLKALRESNIRPEWYNLAWAQRFTYPSAFVLRAMAEAGDLTRAETHAILLDIGWPPALADKVALRWTEQTANGTSAYVGKAQTQLWGTTHAAFVAEEIDAAAVERRLGALDIPAADQQTILSLWTLERTEPRRPLTVEQVKKAYARQLVVRDDALGRLGQLGYSADDADLIVRTWEA